MQLRLYASPPEAACSVGQGISSYIRCQCLVLKREGSSGLRAERGQSGGRGARLPAADSEKLQKYWTGFKEICFQICARQSLSFRTLSETFQRPLEGRRGTVILPTGGENNWSRK